MDAHLAVRYEADAAGGVCFLSGAAKRNPDEKLVNTGVNVDDLPQHGFLYVSEAALVQLAQMIDMITVAQRDALDEDIVILTEQRDRWKARALAQEGLQESLDRALALLAPST